MQSHLHIYNESHLKSNAQKLKQNQDEFWSTMETNSDVSSENTQHSLSCKTIEEVTFDLTPISDQLTDFAISDLNENPYLSYLNLPTIIEEDAEDEVGNAIQQQLERKHETDDSPFWIIPKEWMKSFEDSCEWSELMKALWKNIRIKH